MKRKTIYLIFIIEIFLFASCKKKNTEEPSTCTNKQLPAEYFPAFPKTWWNYRNQNNQLITYSISDNYQNCEGGCRPVFTNLNKCIQGESIVYTYYVGLGATTRASSPIYSLKIDSILHCLVSFSTLKTTSPGNFPWYRRVTLKTDTSITLSNTQTFSNVIVVKEYNIHDSTCCYFDYFSKNIGLIKRDSVNISDTTNFIQLLMLENYDIGN